MASASPAADVVDEQQSPYGGVATRAVALAIDSGIIWVVLLVIGGVFAAIAALVGGIHLGPLEKIIVSGGAIAFAGGYFTICWTTGGRTIGQRMMCLRVIDERGRQPRFVRSVIRTVMLGLCIIVAFTGFIPVLFDRRRRGVHDMVARTKVLYEPEDQAVPGAAP